MYKCHLAEDEIWEQISAGADISPELKEHVAACPKCAGAEKEIRRMLEVMRTDAVPASPDCRSVVMARVSNRQAPLRGRWVYALALMTVLVIGVFVGLHPMHKHMSPQVAHHTPAKSEIHAIERQASTPTLLVPQPKERIRVRHVARATIRHRHTPMINVAKLPVRASTDIQGPREARPPVKTVPIDNVVIAHEPPDAAPEIEPGNTKVLAVTVSWQGIPNPSNSYSYATKDSETGSVTTCTAGRTDDHIYIRMESKPNTEKSPT